MIQSRGWSGGGECSVAESETMYDQRGRERALPCNGRNITIFLPDVFDPLKRHIRNALVKPFVPAVGIDGIKYDLQEPLLTSRPPRSIDNLGTLEDHEPPPVATHDLNEGRFFDPAGRFVAYTIGISILNKTTRYIKSDSCCCHVPPPPSFRFSAMFEAARLVSGLLCCDGEGWA